jgi:hypothetical protein
VLARNVVANAATFNAAVTLPPGYTISGPDHDVTYTKAPSAVAADVPTEYEQSADEIRPRMDEIRHRMDELRPRMDQVQHRITLAELEWGAAAAGVPTASEQSGDELRPRMDELRPRMDQVQPRMDQVGPRMDEVRPRMDEVRPRMDEVRPRMDEIRPRITLAELEWGPGRGAELPNAPFDVVVASDLVYGTGPPEPLVATLTAVIAPHTVCVMALEDRGGTATKFVECAEKAALEVMRITGAELDPMFACDDIWVLRITRRGVP